MKENQSSKKKALSEDELLNVTGGDMMGMRLPDFGPVPCSRSKKEKSCKKNEHCEWNTASSSCQEKPEATGKQMAT